MSDSRELDLEGILAIAESVGLDAERLAEDMGDPAIDDTIRRNYSLAEALGISATPSFVIGEHVIRGAPSLDQFRAIVADTREALAASAGGGS
jgi:predicted DsbA family dithiol-disulfide isomerase